MKKVVCPYCDQPIRGKYCSGCRRIVWKPKNMEVTYYLNERHPEGEDHCQFHGDILTGDMAEAKKRPSSVPNVPKRPQVSNKTASEKNKAAVSKIKTGLIVYFIIVFLGIIAPIIGSVFDAMSHVIRRIY